MPIRLRLPLASETCVRSRFERGNATLALSIGLALLALGACSKPKSFIVLDLRSADTSVISDVTEVVVKVSQDPSFSTTLTYPPKDGKPLAINQTNANTLSVSFAGARNGAV